MTELKTDWLTKLEDLEKEATPGWRDDFYFPDYLPNVRLACHLRNRSKEIAALVRAVQKFQEITHWGMSPEEEKLNRKLNKALNNLLRPEEAETIMLREETCDS